MRIPRRLTLTLLAGLAAPALLAAQTAPMTPDTIPAYEQVRPSADYIRREVMIPMRDGTKLFTVIVMRKGTHGGPMLLTRTPYDAGKATARNASQKIEEILPISDAEFVDDGYIRVYQDVRGLHGSEGDYVMTRPLRGPLNPTAVDHATDAYDTIDWLVKNVPESNGRVGITGSSYPGFTSLMALIDPHPALKAAVPQSPMVDGWIGDDWFHNGAFRQTNYAYIVAQTAKKGALASGSGDDYDLFLQAGSSGDYARAYGLEAFPYVRKLMEHPAYDQYWSEQAVDKLLARRKLTVPTMLVVGEWDQEDSYGAPAVYKALKDKDAAAPVSLVIGPWRHSGVNYDGTSLGALNFEGDTALQFRRDMMKPFLDRYLKDGPKSAGAQPATPSALTYASGINQWERYKAWPGGTPTPLYLQSAMGLGFAAPKAAGQDDYVSDPARPVPFVTQPVRMNDRAVWTTWLVADQRFVESRNDVLTYKTAVLDKPVHIAGAPQVDLFAATTGSDSDWVVKLIDVYPAENTAHPAMAGYELPIGVEIYRGRYVHGRATPAALTPGRIENYKFGLPNVNHVFLPGHRIMVQVQSSLFPLYDRNPQSYVPNIFDAKPGDYVRATQSIVHAPGQASAVWLPVVK